MIRRIHVAVRLVVPEEARAVVERVHEVHAVDCPLDPTLHITFQLTSSYTLVPPTE